MLELSPITASQVRPERHTGGHTAGVIDPRNQAPAPQQARPEASPLNPDRVNQASNSQPPLTDEQLKLVRQLQARDRQVRSHEAAHKGAAGRYARGGASFEYERGPDGKSYAVGGEVKIDVSRPADPQQALEKAQVIQQAALAPLQPSSQDRAVAAQAAQIAAQARVELQNRQDENDNAVAPEQGDGKIASSSAVDQYRNNTTSDPVLDVFA